MSLFGKKIENELEAPPIAYQRGNSLELLRLWASTNGPTQIVLKRGFDNPSVWGIMLADIAKQAASTYAAEGHDAEVVMTTIKERLDAEWSRPTDQGVNL